MTGADGVSSEGMDYESLILKAILAELTQIRKLLTPPVSREIHISTGLALTEDQIRKLIRLVQAQVVRERDDGDGKPDREEKDGKNGTPDGENDTRRGKGYPEVPV